MRLLTLICLLGLGFSLNAQLQSPNEFLPHNLGEHFTPHHLVVDYFEHVAQNSDKVKLMSYGKTNQDRPLILAFVTSKENMDQLEDIRLNNLQKTGMIEASEDTSLDRAVVWLSYSVHGNEAGGSESSMAVLYELVNGKNSKATEWLKNTIVILDPSLNPDGYSRYTHWHRDIANLHPSPARSVREHREPWPGGRVNHYLFDLNRDWAWQTQVEISAAYESVPAMDAPCPC
jgi:murein tripeptide amidase MpaA